MFAYSAVAVLHQRDSGYVRLIRGGYVLFLRRSGRVGYCLGVAILAVCYWGGGWLDVGVY